MAWIISDYSKWKRHQIRGLICSGAELSDEAAAANYPPTISTVTPTFVPDTSTRESSRARPVSQVLMRSSAAPFPYISTLRQTFALNYVSTFHDFKTIQVHKSVKKKCTAHFKVWTVCDLQ